MANFIEELYYGNINPPRAKCGPEHNPARADDHSFRL